MTNPIPIVALDVPTLAAAQKLVAQLGDQCDFYKVGLELFSAEGPAVVQWLRSEGKRVFVDLKLHDIPNTVQSAARSVARLGASLLTVHASGGTAMIAAAVRGAEQGAGEAVSASGGSTATTVHSCGILGVTVLTSMAASDVGEVWGRAGVDVQAEVVRLAGFVKAAGGRGVVCSGQELSALKSVYGAALEALVPGVRLPGGDAHDQQRTITPAAAAAAGADYLVIGRAVTATADPAVTMARVWSDLPRR